MKSFIIKSTLLTIFVFILGAIAYSYLLNKYYLTILPLVPILFYLVTNLVHNYLLRMASFSGSKFTSQYMATSFIKMFFYLIVAVVYVFVNKADAKIFLINYLFFYVVYTAFEVYEISKVVRQINK